LELAPGSGLRFTELDEAGVYWFDRRIPRDLLVVNDVAAK
jgi:hypothetical protein